MYLSKLLHLVATRHANHCVLEQTLPQLYFVNGVDILREEVKVPKTDSELEIEQDIKSIWKEMFKYNNCYRLAKSTDNSEDLVVWCTIHAWRHVPLISKR